MKLIVFLSLFFWHTIFWHTNWHKSISTWVFKERQTDTLSLQSRIAFPLHLVFHHKGLAGNLQALRRTHFCVESSQSHKALGVAWPDWNGLSSVECPPQNFWPVVSRGPTSTRPQTFLSYHNPALVTSWNHWVLFPGLWRALAPQSFMSQPTK